MPNDRVAKTLLAVIAGMLTVIAVRSVPLREPAAVAQPVPGGRGPAAASLQVSAAPNGFLVFDQETGEVMRAMSNEQGVGMMSVGALRRNPAGKWEFVPNAAAGPGAVNVPAGPGGANNNNPGPPNPAEVGRLAKTQADLTTIVTALTAFRLDTGRYPTTEEGLHSLMVQPTGVDNWKGPYVKPSIPMDPWGNPYVYYFPGRADARRGELMSFGPDKKEGGGDDVYGPSLPGK